MGKKNPAELKNTALITGASQGIGYAIAKELAKRSFDLYLVSLPGQNLENLALDLSREFNVRINFMEANLDQKENCQKIFDDIKGRHIPVNMLVNNAGIGSAGIFEVFPEAFYEKQLNLNINAVVYLTRLFLPLLQQQPVSWLLNVSSLGAFFHMPHKEVYIASKSFILSFTKSLQNRFRGTGLNISVLCPGPVNTNPRLHEANSRLTGMAKKTVLSAEEVARIAIKELLAGKEVIIPGRLNRFLLTINRIVPAFIRNHLIRKEMLKQSDIGHELLT
jgi:short-subunit dehydrogenase